MGNEMHDEATGEEVEERSTSGAIEKHRLTGMEITRPNETAALAVAERARAMVESRCVLALKRPRVLLDVRSRLLDECRRPGFAKAARYRRPQGRKQNERTGEWEANFIEGPSIRFVEAAIRLMGNVSIEAHTLLDDEDKRILLIEAFDYETNASWQSEVTVVKTVERRKLARGQRPLGVRQNSYGDDVFIVRATEEEVAQKQASAVSKAARTLGLRLIPGDIVDECQEVCVQVQLDEDAKDPAAARKTLVDKFRELGVTAMQLVEYLGGQALEQITGDQFIELRAVGAAMREGARWPDVLAGSPYRMADEEGVEAKPSGQAAKVATKIQETVAAAKQKAAERKAGGKKAAPAPAAAAPAPAAAAPAPTSTPGGREPGSDG